MKVIHVLGIGCTRCAELKANVQSVVGGLPDKCEILEVHDIDEIVDFGAMMTPALAVDGEVKIQGKVASVEEIAAILSSC